MNRGLTSEIASSVAPKTYRFLGFAQVQWLYARLIVNVAPTQPTPLDSAIESPKNVKHYGCRENLFQLAANLSGKIIKNHVFQGSKRASLAAVNMFLKIHGYWLQPTQLASDDIGNDLAEAHVAVIRNQVFSGRTGEIRR